MAGTLWTSVEAEKGEFWNIVTTGERSQVTMMTVEPGRVAGGPNTHETSDQVSLVLEGRARIRCWDEGPEKEPTERVCPAGSLIVIPAGTQHWVKSVGEAPLVFFSVYAPPEY
ncbi:MAG: cupin domain-containing protein [Candidatus Thermoplasmatota archaeon]|nr:cupin domain-containing protein [Candidatus Thermoplasmatota archaeon]